MPTTAMRTRTKADTINDRFLSIGKADGTAMPKWKGKPAMLTAALAAWEYHVSSRLLRIAESRRDKAIAAAIKAGVLFDHFKKPRPVGTHEIVYSGAIIEIILSVSAGTPGVDHDGFVADLVKAKIDPKLLRRLATKWAIETRPAHKFVSSLVNR